jgi:hypothetical protein
VLDLDLNKPPKRMSSVRARRNRDTILLSLSDDQKQRLDKFFTRIGLIELKSVFIDEMVDMNVMLGYVMMFIRPHVLSAMNKLVPIADKIMHIELLFFHSNQYFQFLSYYY